LRHFRIIEVFFGLVWYFFRVDHVASFRSFDLVRCERFRTTRLSCDYVDVLAFLTNLLSLVFLCRPVYGTINLADDATVLPVGVFNPVSLAEVL
jgi:hypothetical protein